MKIHSLLVLVSLTFGASVATANNYQWTNTLGGSWHVAANWSPNFVPGSGDKAFITTDGTYTVNITASIPVTTFDLGGGSGTPTLVVDNGAALNMANVATVLSGGILVFSNCSMAGTLNVQPGGQLQMLGSGSKTIYSLNLNNQGTVTWGGGTISVGASPVTTISNVGLWQITGNDGLYNGGGTGTNTPTWFNAGTLRKSAGSGQSFLVGMEFVNQDNGVVDALAGTLMLSCANTNYVRGSFTATSPGAINLYGGVWTDGGGTASGTGLIQFTGSTLYLRTNTIPGLKLAGGDIYITGPNTFQQAGTITNLTLDGATLHGTNTVDNGTFTMNGGSLLDRLTVLPAGQLLFSNAATKLLYSATLINQGTIIWTDGGINVGGTPTTVISNGGLWLVQSANNLTLHWGGGLLPIWTNSGTLRKNIGTNTTVEVDGNFFNQPGGLVESLAGTLLFVAGSASTFAGTFNAMAPGVNEFNSGTWTDAGGTATGTGTNRFVGGTLNLRTNTIPGLKLLGGEIYITGTNSFQQAGVITNLTLDGTVLRGTNRVNNGTLAVNVGDVKDQLIIQPAGQLVLAAPGRNLYSATIINQGTVNWTGGSMNVGGTPGTVISNGGLWQINGDFNLNFGGGQTAVWTNSGTLRKTAGSGVAFLTGPSFYNQSGGLVQVDSGTLQLTSITTNRAGTLRLNGGALNANGTLAFSGGTLDGAGAVGVNAFTGGIISPGQGGAGLISFPFGLNLSSNATLLIDGTGTVPGVSYDQLSVIGSVTLGGCNLQVASLPAVPLGASFVIITNDGVDAVSGTFNGLPENSLVTVGAQPFRIHYAGGSGNDVTLVRVASSPVLRAPSGLTNGNWQLTGLGTPSGIYTILATTNFLTWTNIGFATGDLSGNLLFTDTNAFRFQYRFYRTTN